MTPRAVELLAANRERIARDTDRGFTYLLVAQWALAVVIALATTSIGHFHVKVALFGGAFLNSLPIALIRLRPGWWITRHVVTVAQMLWSALLIMVTGGRLETHFHIFGSLAFLAFYRDVRVLVTATLVVVGDHLARGLLWPDSVYGVANPEWWRFLEHSGWVAFEVGVLSVGIVRKLRDMARFAIHEADLEETRADIERQVAERTFELRDSNERYRMLMESTAAIPFEWDLDKRQSAYVSPQLARLLGYPATRLASRDFISAYVDDDDLVSLQEATRAFIAGRRSATKPVDVRMKDVHGVIHHMRVFLGKMSADGRRLSGVMLEITQQRMLELELAQAQKLESVGRLAAGVAHEINTPVQFVGDSLGFLRESIEELVGAIDPERAKEPDLAYLVGELPTALDNATEGLERVTKIVRSMRVFAHSAKEMSDADLNYSLECMLVVARSEYRMVADVETCFGELPQVRCHAGELHQVFLNILVNAAHAIEASGRRGTIRVETRCEGDEVVVSISDTGTGIPEDARARVFDPFYTTKAVGRGTGQGLAIAHAIVVDKHRGSLAFDTEVGSGTTFHVRLPVTASRDSWRSAA